MKLLLIPLLCCVAQVLGFAVQIPYESHGDLSMPGFTELNAALMSGKLDLAPALSRLPLAPTDSLANVIKQFCTDLANECRLRGEEEMALSLDVLASVAPEFAELATIYGQEEEAWRSVFVMRDLGRSVLNLRTKLESTVEVAESPLTLLIQEMLDIINQFGDDPKLVEIKAQADKLAQDFAVEVSTMVGDSTEMLRLGGRLAADALNHREAVPVDLDKIVKAVHHLQHDFQAAVTKLDEQVEELRVAMLRATREGLISAQDMADITIMKSQVQRLAGREAKNISNAVYFVMQASLGVHRALIAFQ